MGKKVVVKITELREKHGGLSLRKFADEVDIRHAALSELANGKRENINFNHIIKIADTFNITDIREIIDIIDEENADS